jgi:hypothetical protein
MLEEAISPTQAKARRAFGAFLRSPAFVVLWISEGLSLIGDRLIMVALVTLTGSVTFLASALVGLLVEQLNVTIVMGSIGGITLAVVILVTIYYHNTSK